MTIVIFLVTALAAGFFIVSLLPRILAILPTEIASNNLVKMIAVGVVVIFGIGAVTTLIRSVAR